MSNFSISATLCILSEDLAYAIEERLSVSSEFTTVMTTYPSQIAKIALILIRIGSNPFEEQEPSFTHIGILRKGQRVATSQVRVKITDIVELPLIPVSTLLYNVSPGLQKNIEDIATKQYKNIPKETSKELFKALLKILPEKKDQILRLANKINTPKLELNNRALDVATEKDATSICLDIFGIDRSQIIQTWDAEEGLNGKSFLTGLTDYTIYEDDAISHDLHSLPGWEQIAKNITGIVEFKNELDERLVIINANRKPLEKALGVDLIYYHRKYQAFTFVQYKIMENQTEKREFYYNPNQNSHNDELLRMDNFFKLLNAEPVSSTLIDYRLTDCPIFFKLCKKIELKAEDASIVPGAYISLNHWNILLKDPSIQGPKGGLQVGFHNLGKRYIGTQLFIELVQKGLLGTNVVASEKVANFIEAAIKIGHSILFAVDDSQKETLRRRRF